MRRMVPSYAKVQEHRSQLLKGVLDMCLLALVLSDTHGYEMARRLESRGLHLSSEGASIPCFPGSSGRGF